MKVSIVIAALTFGLSNLANASETSRPKPSVKEDLASRGIVPVEDSGLESDLPSEDKLLEIEEMYWWKELEIESDWLGYVDGPGGRSGACR